MAAVFAFVVMGRRTHQEAETLRGILATAAPFMLALAAGWVAAAFRRPPASVAAAPVVIGITVAGGLVLRRFVAGEGTAAAFVVVTALFLTAAMLGWRLALSRYAARRRSPAPSAGP